MRFSLSYKRLSLLAAALLLPCAHPALTYAAETPAGGAPEAERKAPAASEHTRKTWIRVSAKRYDFLVFTRSGRGWRGPFAGAQDMDLVGTLGTVLSTDRKLVALHNGALLLRSHKGTARISAGLGTIEVPEGASALIDYIPASRSITIAEVGGAANTKIDVVSHKYKRSATLHSGEEIVIDDKQKDVALKKLADDAGTTQCLNDLQGKSGNLKYDGAPLRMLGAEGSEFRCSGPDAISLRKGELFVEVPDKLIVQTPVADVAARKDAILDVQVDDENDRDAPCVRTKSLSGQGQIEVIAGAKNIEVTEGQELTLAARNLEDADLSPPDGIGRRRSTAIELAKGLHGANADFSIVSFLNESPHVQPLKNGAPASKATIEKVLKSAAAIQTITTQYGAYKSVPRATPRPTPPTHPTGRSA